ncbi:hypothetical protein B0T18DRAFT_433034 [Schizothecium vesticola]|uniref:Uncharacterized protein n=1 Tax=Schizothecium vesticola TaxID=314040 RepID=A0AA40BPT3_9PEZI|nr:hypothetical protein B0T18DRAFT_433034 [Schizothecium vesticola]
MSADPPQYVADVGKEKGTRSLLRVVILCLIAGAAITSRLFSVLVSWIALMKPPIPGFMTTPTTYDYETVQWMETFNTEVVLESLDFEYSDTPTDNTWRCVLGGAQQLAINMDNSLKRNKPQFGQRVTAIRALDKLTMQVDVFNSPIAKTYNGVFNSTTLGCLGRIDTSGANLDYPIHEANRTVSYGPSAKHQKAVLLVSYTWQQDALHLGSLMSTIPDHTLANAQEDANGLRKLLVRELARLHTCPDGPYTQQQLVGALESAVYGVYSWLNMRRGDIVGWDAALDGLENKKNPVTGVPFVELPENMDTTAAGWSAIFGNLKEARYFKGRGRK